VPHLTLIGGPAGAGKSTLAEAWCAARLRAAHIELDAMRNLIVSGLADPQVSGDLQGEQYKLSVNACCALVRVFLDGGYDVAVDDVLEPEAFERHWQPALGEMDVSLVIILPNLEETLRRAAARDKRVRPQIIEQQYAACSRWPEVRRVDTTGLSVEESLALCRQRGFLP
jgi:predicted kinase